MLNGTEIVRCVQARLPDVKNARWRQPFPNCGYFCCEYQDKEQALMVETDSNPIVYGYLSSLEIAVALYVVRQLTMEAK